jgi:hypothetical protein
VAAGRQHARRAQGGREARGIPPVELWLYSRYGGNGIKLVSSDDVNNSSGPVASRDGRYIYFAAREARFSYTPDLSKDSGRSDASTARRRNGADHRRDRRRRSAGRFPDGGTLVFVSRRDADSVLVARDLSSGAERILATGITRDEQEGFARWTRGRLCVHAGRKVADLLGSRQAREARDRFRAAHRRSVHGFGRALDRASRRLAGEAPDRTARGAHSPLARAVSRRPARRFDALGRVWLQESPGTARSARRAD